MHMAKAKCINPIKQGQKTGQISGQKKNDEATKSNGNKQFMQEGNGKRKHKRKRGK